MHHGGTTSAKIKEWVKNVCHMWSLANTVPYQLFLKVLDEWLII